MKLIPTKENKQNHSSPLWDNTAHIAKVLYRFKSQANLLSKALGNGASLNRLLICKLPYYFKDSYFPPSMHIEFTNACNLKCVYCNNPNFANPRAMLDEDTFDNLIKALKRSDIDRVCIGGGEATLHPKFIDYTERLAKVSKLLTIVTNGQWKDYSITETLLKAPVDYIEVSVEPGGKEEYERIRVGSNFELTVKNLSDLKALKRKIKSPSHINIRLMVRPSQVGDIEKEGLKFWKPYCDSIMPQYVLKDEGADITTDVFLPQQMETKEFPRCSLPFSNIQVRCNGDVPLCQISGSTLDASKKLIVGNINDMSVNELWNSLLFKQYRTGLRNRKTHLIPICEGCKGC